MSKGADEIEVAKEQLKDALIAHTKNFGFFSSESSEGSYTKPCSDWACLHLSTEIYIVIIANSLAAVGNDTGRSLVHLLSFFHC